MPGFDFSTAPDRRGTGSSKWNKYADRDVIPLWVTDMDFATAPAIVEALAQRARHPVYGYAAPGPGLNEAALGWLADHYGWHVDPEWLVWLPGVVGGFNLACRTGGRPGDAVLMHTPVYYPFRSAPGNAGQTGIEVPLRLDGGRWCMDIPALTAACTPRTRTYLLCNPHNPNGRAWSRTELEALAGFCLQRGLLISADEIHCDLVLDPLPHVPIAMLDADVAARTITLMAPSKTFNIPGLHCSIAIIPNDSLRRRFIAEKSGLVPGIGPLDCAAAEAAWRDRSGWREALLDALRTNRDALQARIAALPGVRMTHVEATYLAWIDVRDLGLDDPPAWFEDHGLGFSPGGQFGDAGFIRWNFAAPASLMARAMDRFEAAVHAALARR